MQQINKGNKQRIIIIVIVMIIRAELLYQDISCCRPPLYPVSTSNSDILMREQPRHLQMIQKQESLTPMPTVLIAEHVLAPSALVEN